MEKNELIELLVVNAYELWCIAIENIINYKFYDKMNSPKIGDTVLEITSISIVKDHSDSIGILLEISKNKKGNVYIIKRLADDKIIRLTNCKFIKVFSDREFGR